MQVHERAMGSVNRNKARLYYCPVGIIIARWRVTTTRDIHLASHGSVYDFAMVLDSDPYLILRVSEIDKLYWPSRHRKEIEILRPLVYKRRQSFHV
jgi:hypothetical protein